MPLRRQRGRVIHDRRAIKAFCGRRPEGARRLRRLSGLRRASPGRAGFQRQIRTCPKPVVAMVAGYSIGGGHVLHMMCDLISRGGKRHLRPDGPNSAPLTAVGALRIWRVSLVEAR